MASTSSSSSWRDAERASSVSSAIGRSSPEQVRARIAAQASDEDRARVADVLLDNDGELEQLGRPGGPTLGTTSARAHPTAARFILVTYRAVFFDAGETLVHPAPSFPELFAQS